MISGLEYVCRLAGLGSSLLIVDIDTTASFVGTRRVKLSKGSSGNTFPF
jgi:hypothetical protein